MDAKSEKRGKRKGTSVGSVGFAKTLTWRVNVSETVSLSLLVFFDVPQ